MLVILLIIFALFTSPVFAVSDIQVTDFSSDSSIEWIQINNSSSNSIDISGWYFKDLANTVKPISNICISANSTQIFEFSSYLNNGGDTVNLYNKNNELVDTLVYTAGVTKDKPTSSNTCAIPTNTPTPTNTPSPTNTPTPTPTTDPAIINPSSGINLTEFMPYSSIEWIELYNSNDYDVKLVAWKIEDSSANTRNISELRIKAKSYAIYEFTLLLNNSDSDKLILYNQDQKIIDNYQYPAGKLDLDKSWSKNDNGWCQTLVSKSQSNYQCYITPTLTPTVTPTDEPIQETPIIEPTPNIDESQKYNSNQNTNSNIPTEPSLVLGDSTIATKQNFLPIILIFGGAILLISPLIISKLKKS